MSTPGMTISPRYDSLIAKLIVHKPTRAEAIACMQRCLDEFVIEPIKTTIPLHREILNHPAVLKGDGGHWIHRAHVVESAFPRVPGGLPTSRYRH